MIPHKQNIFADHFVYTLPQSACKISYQIFTCEWVDGLVGSFTSILSWVCLGMFVIGQISAVGTPSAVPLSIFFVHFIRDSNIKNMGCLRKE